MDDIDSPERNEAISRVEAFSDGVLAIIITIMVLELKAPADEDIGALWRLWPVLIAYLLSYAYIAIYWVNHHRLLGFARAVTGGLLWANMALLFTLSLVPFTTAYLGEHRFGRDATLLYLASLLLAALAYFVLQTRVAHTGARDAAAVRYHRATLRKGIAAIAIYALGMMLSFATPALGTACAALVAVFWMLPWSRLDRVFAR